MLVFKVILLLLALVLIGLWALTMGRGRWLPLFATLILWLVVMLHIWN